MTVVAQVVRYISESVVDVPQAVEVYESVGESVIMIDLKVAPEDMGRIIGRRGSHINAMRALAQVFSKKMGKKVNLELIEEK